MHQFIFLFGTFGIFLGWNAPNHYPPWTTFHLEYLAAWGALLIGLVVQVRPNAQAMQSRRGDLTEIAGTGLVSIPASARMWMLAGLLPLLQYLTGELMFRGDALVGLLYALGVGLCIYTGHLWSAQEGPARVMQWLCLTVVISGLAANGLALVQWLRLGTPSWWAMELIDDRPYGNLAQPNHFGLLMVMALVAVTALFESAAIRSRWVYALAVAYFGWGVHISQSRGSAVAVLLVVTLWLLTRTRVPTRLRLRFVLPAMLAWCALALGYSPLQEALLLDSAGFRAPSEAGARKWIWLHFWEAITQRPWLGYGFNQAVLALSEVADRVHPSRNVVFAHNVVLDLMTWFGIPLALLMATGLALWMSRWLHRHPEPAFMAQRHIVFALWLALLFQSLLEFPFAHAYFLLPLALMAGAVTQTPDRQRRPSGCIGARASRAAQALTAATAIALLLLGWEYFQMEGDFRQHRFERANISIPPERAAMREPLLLDHLAALNASASIIVAAGMSPEELQALHRLARRFHILSTRMDYAKALALNGRLTEAEQELTVIRSVYDEARGERIERQWRAWLAEALKARE